MFTAGSKPHYYIWGFDLIKNYREKASVMTQLMLVEDDPILGRGLSVYLDLEGFKTLWVKDIKSALGAIENTPCDLIILDVNLPDGSGIELCKKMRTAGTKAPIIFLTAKTDEDSVVSGFSAGANDYVKKPFGNRELLARLKAHLREPSKRDAELKFGDLRVVPHKRQAYVKEKEIDLNRREFDILAVLMQNSEAVVTREGLLNALDKEGEIFDRTIDSHVSHIRSKLKKAFVETVQITSVYGVGYRLEKL
jgi:DNA-binding response OmpR family regulator